MKTPDGKGDCNVLYKDDQELNLEDVLVEETIVAINDGCDVEIQYEGP